jgi:hypothetical protein
MSHWSHDPDEEIVRMLFSAALVLSLIGFGVILILAIVDRIGGYLG